MREAAAFITEEAAGGTVYVHCKIGYSRSAAVVGAYLLASGQAGTAEEAVALLRRERPSLIVRPEAMAALCAFEQGNHARRKVVTVEEGDNPPAPRISLAEGGTDRVK